MFTYKNLLLIGFAAFAYFTARLSPDINQQLLHFIFICILIWYVPSIRLHLHAHLTHSKGSFLSRKFLIGASAVLAFFILLYNNWSGGFITYRLDAGSILFVCYIVLTAAIGFSEEDHNRGLMIVFILAFSYYIVGYKQAAETTGALLYLVLLLNVGRRLTKEIRT